MNLLGWVFGMLLIFACSYSLSLHKFLLSNPIEKSFQNHLKASRKIFNSYEREYFITIRCINEKKRKREVSPQKAQEQATQKRSEKPNYLNAECSHLNLWPLLAEGQDEHLALYEAAARLLRTFYRESFFKEEPRLEYLLLNQILDAAKIALTEADHDFLSLEKLSLKEPKSKRLCSLQSIYYRMLKGTKRKDGGGYPPLVDYFSFEKKESQVCLKHASIEMLSALFGSKVALSLYDEIHQSKAHLSKEKILEVCARSGMCELDKRLFELIDLKSSRHEVPSKKILVGEEGDISLRKRVYLPS